MKIRLLPDQDLARIAPLPRELKYAPLRKLKFGRPPYSYAPVRKRGLDILGVAPGPLFPGTRTAWPKIEEVIRQTSRTPDELQANVEVGRGLYRFAEEQEIVGRREEFRPFPVGLSDSVSYWYPAVISIGGIVTIPYIDYRKAATLTREARRFVFSVMHERIRVSDPETFGDVQLGIISFSCPDKCTRIAELSTDSEYKLHDFEALNGMVKETYEVWQEIINEREEEARRATGTGPLGI